MKGVTILAVVVAGSLVTWFILGQQRDARRQEQTRKRLARECLTNLQRIKELVNGYIRQHGELPPNLVSLRDSDPDSTFTFRCRLCYDFTRTVFSLPGLNSDSNRFAGWEGFAKCSYGHVADTSDTGHSNQLWVFCVGLHPEVHVLLQGGQVKAITPAEFVSRIETLPKSSIIYPQNFWTAPGGQ